MLDLSIVALVRSGMGRASMRFANTSHSLPRRHLAASRDFSFLTSRRRSDRSLQETNYII